MRTLVFVGELDRVVRLLALFQVLLPLDGDLIARELVRNDVDLVAFLDDTHFGEISRVFGESGFEEDRLM